LGFDPGDPAYFTYDDDPDLEAAQENKKGLRDYVEESGNTPAAVAFLSDAGRGEAYYDPFQEGNTAFQLGLTKEQAREHVTLQEAAHKVVHSHPDLAGKVSDADNEIIGDAASARLYPEQVLFSNMFDMAGGEAPEGYAARHDLLKEAMGEVLEGKGLGTADAFVEAYDAYRDAQPTTGPDGRPVSDLTIFRGFLDEFARTKGGGPTGEGLSKALQGAVSEALRTRAGEAIAEARK
jgi:hypothetical protein